MNHCQSNAIKKLHEINISIDKERTSKTIDCETCSLFKMHRMINRNSAKKTTKLYQIVHFDLTILNIDFDDTTCIAHFTNELTTFNWIYSLLNHKRSTLLSIFKFLIQYCDRVDIVFQLLVSFIRTEKKISIDSTLEQWFLNQKIAWQWSAKNTSKQNELSKKYEVLLSEKVRCIRIHVKLLKKIYSECYLAAVYLLSRTSKKALN